MPKSGRDRHHSTAGERGEPLNVAVTGAGGFVGGAVCAVLEDAGHAVVRLARRPIPGHPETILWDLRRDYAGDAPLPAVDAVVHCAAAIATLDLDGTAREANVGGSLRIADAWPGVPLVYISSASVYPASHGEALREDDATGEGLHDPYSRSKWEAERGLVAEAERTGRELTVLRASIIYGPGDPLLFPRIHKLRLGRFVLLPGGRKRWSMTPVGMLADAVRASVERRAPGVRILNVAEEPPERICDFFLRLLEEDAGRRLRGVPFPAWPLRGVAWCVEAVWRALRLRREPILNRAAVAYIAEERVLDLGRLRAGLTRDEAERAEE